MTGESSRHAAVDAFLRNHTRPSSRRGRISETPPFDLFLLRPASGGILATFVVVKCVDDENDGALTATETEFGLSAERLGAAYVVARYRVVDGRPQSEQLFRPFLEPTPPECEIVFEVAGT